jgi:hypothetical protein
VRFRGEILVGYEANTHFVAGSGVPAGL